MIPAEGLLHSSRGRSRTDARPVKTKVAVADAGKLMASGGEEKAVKFKAAVMPYLDDAYNLARYLTRNSQDAEDVVQDAFLRAFKFFDTFHGTNARAWLLAIVRNCFLGWVKAQSTAGRRSAGLDATEALETQCTADCWGAEPGDPETQLISSSDAETVTQLVNQLPEPFREILVLREMSDLSYREIAGITAVPVGTVMSRLARARELLKEAWESQNGGGRS